MIFLSANELQTAQRARRGRRENCLREVGNKDQTGLNRVLFLLPGGRLGRIFVTSRRGCRRIIEDV